MMKNNSCSQMEIQGEDFLSRNIGFCPSRVNLVQRYHLRTSILSGAEGGDVVVVSDKNIGTLCSLKMTVLSVTGKILKI